MSAGRPAASLIPASYLPYLANSVAAIAIIPTTLGVTALINPEKTLQQMEMPATKTDKTLVNGITRLLGSRLLATGISTFALWYHTRQGQATYRTLGASFLPFALFLAADGWVVKHIVGNGQWGHWAWIPIVFGLGLGLMGVY